MSNYNKLQKVLTEVFQLDQADLDFGIYRIMNQKRDAINDFLQNSLPVQVRQLLEQNLSGDAKGLQEELDKTIAQATALGADPNTLPKVKELKDKIAASSSIDTLEQEVFSHLANFFKRYYDGGDFISLRRYKKDVYAIPYEGEEVKLHWANHDQYYIKTSEYLRNYAFKLAGNKLIRFDLKEASTEQNNNKAQNDQERRFAIYDELPVEVDGNTLTINFTYEPHKKSIKQDDLTKKAVEVIKTNVPVDFTDVFALAPTESNKQRTLLDKHIYSFVSRNTFDYFIHKDLGGFFRRELDFYIKNEVLHIDDINTENEIAFNSQISKIKALKQVASKIILFLEQLENFQKKLWLKKKFVINSNYCITLDRIPEDYYDEIVANKAQLDEWEKLFDLTIKTVKELEKEPFLVLDTKFFPQDFIDRVLAEFDDLDEKTNGLLINSENFQALNLLQERYRGQIKTTYLDPPYNTGNDGFIYKDGFSHSSWLSFMDERLLLNYNLLTSNGSVSTSINSNENLNLQTLLGKVYDKFENSFTIKVRHEKRIIRKDIRYQDCIEYLNIASKYDFNPNRIVNEGEDKLSDYIYKIELSNDNPKTVEINGYKVQIFSEDEYNLTVTEPSESSFKRYTIRGSLITQSGSASEYYEINLRERRKIDGKGTLYKVIGMGLRGDGLGHRYIMQPKEKGGDNGIYFQGMPLKQDVEKGLPHPNYYDFVKEFNDCGDEGGVIFKNGKKPVKFLEKVLEVVNHKKDDILLDYFGGSASSGHVVIKLNRVDNGNRKYILMEMGSYFDSITKPRVQKVIYSDNWKNGLPQDKKGISQMFKYMALESYEDTLNNLSLHKTENQQAALELNDKVNEEYLLQYMLDVESREHLFNLEIFKNPFNYQLNVTENNELIPTTVDLVETFNYLIGLKVKKTERIREFKIVSGENLKGDKILVLWRNLEKTTNDDLDKFVEKLDIKVFDGEYDIIYVNGDNNLSNFKKEEESWKVRLIEEEFFNKMFDVKDI
ncbi:adenine-specific DNA-methyltransferase [Flavobacterium sp. 28A]|uniref:DNA methyltransferase n=1 Tax=Flavobacterium sp. 28A TaxID=2735895 RepID=UPI00156E4028|nr:DNA methyltransferase [Flavobacterium sp. 28A]NRT15279.1 adenine-specific DNA-methyltransferase [Flavobacterium sp. 28A]